MDITVNRAAIYEAAEKLSNWNRCVRAMVIDVADADATGAAIEASGPFQVMVNSTGPAHQYTTFDPKN